MRSLLREIRLWNAHRIYKRERKKFMREIHRRLAADVERRAAAYETHDFVKRHNAALKNTGRKVI